MRNLAGWAYSFDIHSFDDALFTYISISQAITGVTLGSSEPNDAGLYPALKGFTHQNFWAWISDDQQALATLIDTGFHKSALWADLSVNLNMHVASSLGDDATKSSHNWTTVRLTSPVIPASLQPSR